MFNPIFLAAAKAKGDSTAVRTVLSSEKDNGVYQDCVLQVVEVNHVLERLERLLVHLLALLALGRRFFLRPLAIAILLLLRSKRADHHCDPGGHRPKARGAALAWSVFGEGPIPEPGRTGHAVTVRFSAK